MKQIIAGIVLMIFAFIFWLCPDALPQNYINFMAFVWLAIAIAHIEEK